MEQKNKKQNFIILVLLCLLVVSSIFSLVSGTAKITYSDFWNLLFFHQNTKIYRILIYIRIPRICGAILAGAALGLSGAVIQAVFDNPLASPNMIGVNSGAGFMVALCGMMIPNSYHILPIAAFFGAFLTVSCVFLLAKYTGSSKLKVILSGIAVNYLLNAATDAIYMMNQEALLKGFIFKIGRFNGIRTDVLLPAGCLILLTTLAVNFFHNELEILSFGEEIAQTLGLHVSFFRILFLAFAALLAGAAVSFCGLIGFVGLIVPHIARILMGKEQKYVLIATSLLGALFLVICDWIARILFAPYEFPVGMIVSFLGAPFFISLIIKQRRHEKS